MCRIRGACGRVHFAVVIAILGLDRACFSIKDATRDAGVAIVEITLGCWVHLACTHVRRQRTYACRCRNIDRLARISMARRL